MTDNLPPLDIHVTKGTINGKLYDVVSYDEYANNFEACQYDTAIATKYQGNDIILPYKGKYSGNPMSPGVYSAGLIDFFIYPDQFQLQNYVADKLVQLDNTMSIKSLLENSDLIATMNEPWITSPDNITRFPIQEEDQPEMRCLKTALNEKNIDFDKYGVRFGDNFPNDKRQLKNNGVTLNIIKRFCDKMDMEAVLTLRDKNDKVPNPIGREISVSLTESYIDDSEEN